MRYLPSVALGGEERKKVPLPGSLYESYVEYVDSHAAMYQMTLFDYGGGVQSDEKKVAR